MDPSHYQLSPINGGLHNLGKISVFIGSKEMLVADARKLQALAESNKIDLDYFEFKDMVHSWMFLNLPESRQAKELIIQQIINRIVTKISQYYLYSAAKIPPRFFCATGLSV